MGESPGGTLGGEGGKHIHLNGPGIRDHESESTHSPWSPRTPDGHQKSV